MCSNSPNYTELKSNLHLALSQLKLLQKKKNDLIEEARSETANFISAGKYDIVEEMVEYIIRDDYQLEALEIVEMYCDLLLTKFDLVTNMKELDDGIAEAVSGLIWVAPKLQSDCNELEIIADLLAAKYGSSYAEACRAESIETISDRLKYNLSTISPHKTLMEKYIVQIAKCFDVPYFPDPEVMEMDGESDLGDGLHIRSPNYTKLKTNLRLALSRLKLLEKKKTELTEKARREIADFIAAGKYERAKIRVEYIIREDYLVEALEIVEMYCDLLLARFGLVTNMKELDDGIAEAVSSLIWVAPRLQSDCNELKIIADMLTSKYGPSYAEACRIESIETISAKLKHKLSIQSPPKILVEKYVIEIAKSYNIPYEPDPQVMDMDRGSDAMLIDLSDKNNLGGGGGGMPQPPGFVGFPQLPALPNLVDPPAAPFAYPPRKGCNFDGPSAPPPAFNYNIPPAPGDDKKESNTDFMDNLPTYNMVYPDLKPQDDPNLTPVDDLEDNSNNTVPYDDNLENSDNKPKPTPRLKMNDKTYDLPELPSVPSNIPNASGRDDDIDFDDLTKRFNELKKKF